MASSRHRAINIVYEKMAREHYECDGLLLVNVTIVWLRHHTSNVDGLSTIRREWLFTFLAMARAITVMTHTRRRHTVIIEVSCLYDIHVTERWSLLANCHTQVLNNITYAILRIMTLVWQCLVKVILCHNFTIVAGFVTRHYHRHHVTRCLLGQRRC